jgi:hypothetical protein
MPGKSTTRRMRGYRISVWYSMGEGPKRLFVWDSDIPEVWLTVKSDPKAIAGKLVRSGRKFAEFKKEGLK